MAAATADLAGTVDYLGRVAEDAGVGQAAALGFEAQWAHLRKLGTRLGGWTPATRDPVELAMRQHQAADRFVRHLTAGSEGLFEARPDRAKPGDTIIWRDNWIGRSETGRDGREGHRLRSTTPEGRRCTFWVSDEHCVGVTGVSTLSGRKHRSVVALVTDLDSDQIHVDPILVGQLVRLGEDLFAGVQADELRLPLVAIDQFAKLDLTYRPTKSDLAKLGKLSEAQVKHALARIVGEPFVPKDWGGERSDLNTARVSIGGEYAEVSFVLKGPAAPEKMTIRTLGSNGDQIDRALTERPDVIVVQHYGFIDATVRHMLERYCFHETYARHRPTRWAVMDGVDTARVLKAYGEMKG